MINREKLRTQIAEKLRIWLVEEWLVVHPRQAHDTVLCGETVKMADTILAMTDPKKRTPKIKEA